ncbi:hypothetical protein [Reyranella sp. CPCC 100927]|uniref:hypothetical protein n=1 Tax=Reyranella sp. CPCC 100927 TaxID=2599616 RepID=UPI0011B82CC6|nr:hypothetical protein [Reyranella sp. CPCC 100927]TWT09631.1 hypothetical protein FQU96_20945 [Reyranella sp. CPCC 100927]
MTGLAVYRVRFVVLALLAALMAVATPAPAVPPDTPDWKNCADFLINDESEPACTRLIQAGTLAPADLAQVHYYRGMGRYFRDEFPTAIADLSTTIRLTPSHAGARMMRMAAYWDNNQWLSAAIDLMALVWRAMLGNLTYDEDDA